MKKLLRWIHQEDRLERLERAVAELEKVAHPMMRSNASFETTDFPFVTVNDLGSRIRAVRHFMGLTQLQFANRFGLESQVAVSHWENNDTQPTIDTALKICEISDCSIEWLLTGRLAQNEDFAIETTTSKP